MKISGFTFIRNGQKLDYPIVEAIKSILPICDEMIVAVGNSEDDTLGLIRGINSPKIKIIETIWDDSLRANGKVLAVETDKAFAAIAKDSDWAFYIQGDEVVHEKYLPVIKAAMEQYLDKPEVEGLLLKYLHFYGSYAYIGDTPNWYRREIRVVRNDKKITSYRDAQGFRTTDNQKLKVKLIDAYVYHYGWVSSPEQQKIKMIGKARYWDSDEEIKKFKVQIQDFDYSKIESLTYFEGTHPAVMLPRIEQESWLFDFDIQQKRLSTKNRFKMWFEKLTGRRIGEYRNYQLI
jgi:hypothetical protein